METYLEFLKSKIVLAKETGFDIDPGEINPALKPHQRDSVIWALRGGRRALFQSFGLGKTVQEIEFCHQAVRHDGGRALIVLPLGVRQEFARDAEQILGYPAPKYITDMAELAETDAEIVMTNYERVRDGDIDPAQFTAVALDEASVLRSFGSKTYQVFLPKFRGVKYKLVCTATPSPNRYKELIHYAGYLEIMDTGQALTRFFQRDSTKANNLTLYPHKEDEFWLWVSSWALFVGKPSDLGYDDTGYDLPPLDVRTHVIADNYGRETYRLGWTEQCKDGSKMGVGCPEYILLFRKLPTDRSKAYADEKVVKSKDEYTRAQWQIDAHGFWRSSGDRLVTKEEIMSMDTGKIQAAYRKYSRGTVYDYAEHVRMAKELDAEDKLPATFMVVAPGSWTDEVWDDINRMRTLNTTQSQRRKQMHVCPLQLDIVDRLINRYSNPGELVLDPFGGLGTVALEAMKAGRRGYTIELNSGYFRDAVGYLKEYEREDMNISLFDLIGGAI